MIGRRAQVLAILVALAGAGIAVVLLTRPTTRETGRREAAYRANNRAVAFLEQFAYDQAIAALREALTLDPDLRLARINLPIALMYAGQADAAAIEAAAAQASYPDAPQPSYLLGLIARSRNDIPAAIQAFERVRQIDPDDVGAKVQLAQVYLQQQRYADAAALAEAALATEPYHVTAAYNLGMALTRAGAREAGEQALQRFQQLRETPYAITYSDAYLEQGRYAEAVASTGAEPELVSTDTPNVTFTAASAGSAGSVEPPAPPSGMTLADLDGDADLDLVVGGARLQLLRNDGAARFTDITADAGVDPAPGSTGILAADYDNDLRVDLFVVGRDAHRLYRQEGQGRFRDVTRDAGLSGLPAPGLAAAWLDIDHDGDLDLFFGGVAAASRVLRNNGDGRFTDITPATKIDQAGGVLAVAPTDFDNRRDIDLLVVSSRGRPQLFRNMRDGSFADVAAAAGLPDGARFISLAVGDVNKDGYTDAFLGQAAAPGEWALSDGRGRFRVAPAVAATSGATAAQLLDYDNDGLLDLFVVTSTGPRLLRNGAADWIDVTSSALASMTGRAIESAAAADLDLDGDTDLVTVASGNATVWRNDGRTGNRSLRVRLTGRVSNRSGIGSRVELRAGSLRQQLETVSATPPVAPADLVFGLGGREAADVVRVLWPSGILQAETDLGRAGERGGFPLLELDRKPSSCPYLFTWNGREFEFVTDFMGGGEMGYWEGPGLWNVPDPDEYVRIAGSQLQERNGRFEIRVTNELEETLFADTVRLFAVTHPAGTEVFPDEGLRAKPPAFRLFVSRDLRPPLSAVDDHGHDVLAAIARLDRQFVDDFALLPIRGYAREHTLTLELPPAPSRQTRLLLTGWTDYAFSSDNVAAHQGNLALVPPALDVLDEAGHWKTIDADVGIPVGRPQTLVIDLANRFLSSSRTIRLRTSMRVYWDRILVAAPGDDQTVTTHALQRVDARLRWRGFSVPQAPDGKEPYLYNYEETQEDAPWKLMPGRYTREGDVNELLGQPDDRFVISRPGDEIALSFDASPLPPLPAGFMRTFLLHAVGYSKEMNFHSASPDQAAPIPFRAMSRYPYSAPERYPHEQDLDRFHTRVVPRSIGTLVQK